MKNSLITIIIPVYNVEEYLDCCLNSIEKQTFKDYDVIIVDDGSTDKSSEICDRFALKKENVKVIHKMNGGLSSARNAGIKAAKGQYLMFIDSDDFLINEYSLKEIADSLYLTNADLLISSFEEYDEYGTDILKKNQSGKWEENAVYDMKSLVNSLYRENDIWVTAAPTKIINREFCIKNKLMFVEGIYHEDDEWIARLYLSEPKTAFTYRPWYGYRHREGSIVSSVDNDKKRKKIFDKIKISRLMLKNNNSIKYKNFLIYTFDYLFNALAAINTVKIKNDDLINYVSEQSIPYYKVIFTKNIKQILKVLYIVILGEKKFIEMYKG